MTTQTMTIADWLQAQIDQQDNPAWKAGYVTGLMEGQRRALMLVLETIRASQKESPANAID